MISFQKLTRNKLVFSSLGHASYNGDGIAILNREELEKLLQGDADLEWRGELRGQFLDAEKFYILKNNSTCTSYAFFLRHRSKLSVRQILDCVSFQNAEKWNNHPPLTALLKKRKDSHGNLIFMYLREKGNAPSVVNFAQNSYLPIVLPENMKNKDYQTLFSSAADQGDVMFQPRRGSLLKEMRQNDCDFFVRGKEAAGNGNINMILLSRKSVVIPDEKLSSLKKSPGKLLDDIGVVPVSSIESSPFVLTENKDGKMFLLLFCGMSPRGMELLIQPVLDTGLPTNDVAAIKEFRHQQLSDVKIDTEYRKEFQAWEKRMNDAKLAKAKAAQEEESRKIAEMRQSGDTFPKTQEEINLVYRLLTLADYDGLINLCNDKKLNFNVDNKGIPLWAYILSYEPQQVTPEIHRNKLKILKFMFENGANSQAKTRIGNMAAYNAACYNNFDAYRMLLTYGMDVSLQDPDGKNMLDVLMERKQLGVPIDETMLKDLQARVTPSLLTIVKSGILEALTTALKEEKNLKEINNYDQEGSTPLHYAAKAGYADICRELLKNGADPCIPENFGNAVTPVERVIWYKQTDALLVFWEFKDKIPQHLWIKCFSLAANCQYIEGFKFFFEKGLDPEEKDRKSQLHV